MSESLLVVLIFLPAILAFLASAVCWRLVTRPILFFVTSMLSLDGLQGVFVPVATSAFLPSGGSGLSSAAANEAFTYSVIVGAAFQLTVGIGFLWWLYRAFRKP